MSKLRRFWWRHVRRYRYEICQGCGRPVSQSTGRSFWTAPDRVWLAVYETDAGIRCIPCFTADARKRGIHISWRAYRAATAAGRWWD